MSRMRGLWLDEHEPLTGDEPPTTGTRRLRGNWLATERDADDNEDEGERVIHGVPRWTGWAIAAGVLTAIGMVVAALGGNGNFARAVVVLPVLAFVAYRAAVRFARADGQPAIVPIVMGGFGVKLAGTLARYYVNLQVYGRSDSQDYDSWGKQIAPGLRHFHLIDLGGNLTGTNFVRLLTGIVYAVTPGGILTGYLVFGFFSYLGMLFFWRAYRRAVSNRSDLRYLQVLMVLPSLAFWPSALGKDAWMVLAVGIASYGVANVLTNRVAVGWIAFTLGSIAIAQVRPHVGIPVFIGFFFAELIRKRSGQGAGRALVSFALLIVIGGAVLTSAAHFLGVGNWTKANVQQELDNVATHTGEGGSQFNPIVVNTPVQFPMAAFTVLYRPMPYEAHSPQELATAVEDIALLGLTILAARRILTTLRHSRRQPYFLYCVGAISLFVVEYSTFSNFALIARERTQIFPLLLVFLCIPRAEIERLKTPANQPTPDVEAPAIRTAR